MIWLAQWFTYSYDVPDTMIIRAKTEEEAKEKIIKKFDKSTPGWGQDRANHATLTPVKFDRSGIFSIYE